MKNWLFLTLCLSGFYLSANAQDTLTLLREVPLPGADYYNVDVFGHFYLSNEDQLQKRAADGALLYTYSNPLLGPIASVDLLNAMQPLVFFNEVNTLAFLDNRLNESRQVLLNNLGFIDPVMVQLSDQENVWIYDQQQDKLLRLALATGKINAQSINLTQLLSTENQPLKLMANFDKLVLIVPGQGALLFDPLGSYQKVIPLPKDARTSLVSNGLYYWLNNQLHYYSFKTAMTQKWALATAEPMQVKVVQDKVYLFYRGKAVIYQKVKNKKAHLRK